MKIHKMKRAEQLFDVKHFAKLKAESKRLSTTETFRHIYDSNHWASNTSVSGTGSNEAQTAEIIKQIPILMGDLGAESLVDIPCGDFSWLRKLDLDLFLYVGGDILSELVEKNITHFQSQKKHFIHINLIEDDLPTGDLLLCRDCLVHFSIADIHRTLANIKRSSIKYWLTTTFAECEQNTDITTGDWRVINLQKPPFNLPKPMRLINEHCTEGQGTYADKCLGLWKVADL
jgi:hypothetical protein